MKSVLVSLFVMTVGSLASAATCGGVDDAIATMREAARTTVVSKSKKAKLSEVEALQVLSALISYKLQTAKLTADERQALQEEHEGACSVLRE